VPMPFPEIGDIPPPPSRERCPRGASSPIFLPSDLTPSEILDILQNIELLTPVDVYLGDTQLVDSTAIHDIILADLTPEMTVAPMTPKQLEDIIEEIEPDAIVIKVTTAETEPVMATLSQSLKEVVFAVIKMDCYSQKNCPKSFGQKLRHILKLKFSNTKIFNTKIF